MLLNFRISVLQSGAGTHPEETVWKFNDISALFVVPHQLTQR